MTRDDVSDLGAVVVFVSLLLFIAGFGTFVLDLGTVSGPPEASVNISSEYDSMYNTHTVTVKATSLENAERILVVAPDSVQELGSTGDSTRINGIESGDTISIVGTTSTDENTLRTYTAPDS